MTMLEHSQPSLFNETELELTQSAEASRARTLARRAKVQELKAKGPGYGVSTRALLASYDHKSSSWRTSQRCLVEGLTEFLETWPRSGMMQNGTAYQLPPLVRLTDETASGLWLTPTATERWAKDDTEIVVTANGTPRRKYKNGKTSSLGLSAQVRKLWPTPTVNGNYNHAGSSKKAGDGLATAVKYWPTPCASDHRDRGGPSTPAIQRRKSIGKSIELSMTVDGALNPTWVEWLMGFPTGFTDLKPSETP